MRNLSLPFSIFAQVNHEDNTVMCSMCDKERKCMSHFCESLVLWGQQQRNECVCVCVLERKEKFKMQGCTDYYNFKQIVWKL